MAARALFPVLSASLLLGLAGCATSQERASEGGETAGTAARPHGDAHHEGAGCQCPHQPGAAGAQAVEAGGEHAEASTCPHCAAMRGDAGTGGVACTCGH
jgi:hypothetical protein